MAMRIVKERVCDLCGSSDGVRQFRVGVVGNGKGVTPDLCDKCGKPLDDLLIKTASHRSNSPLRKPREVLTPEEVKKRRRK